MGKVFTFRRLPKHKWIVLLGALLIPLVIYFTYNQYLASKKNLNNLPVQLDKVLTIEQGIACAEELEDMRTEDTKELFFSVVGITRQSLLQQIFSFIILSLVALGIIGIPLASRAARENNIYRLILATTKNAIIIINRNGKVALINRVAESIFDIDRSNIVGRSFAEVFTGRSHTGEIAFTYPVDQVLRTGEGKCNVEITYTDGDGWNYSLLVDCLLLHQNEDVTGAMLLLRDITEQKVIEDKLKGLAVRDGLTLIYNHSYLKQVLTREVERASSRNSAVSFLILDLDSFKNYNDNFGHPAGDQLLKELAQIMQKHVRANDTVGRYGGDEFAAILPDADISVAREVAERLRTVIENFSFPHSELVAGGRVTVSVGIACYPLQAKNAADLVRLADEAMYKAKRTTKNRVEVYSSVLEGLSLHLQEKEGEMFLHSLEVMLRVLKIKDPYTYYHSEKVSLLANKLAKEVLSEDRKVTQVTIAALLHDLGKLEIPIELLNKPGPLSDDEWQTVRRHPELGMDVVKQIKPFEELATIVLHHHERYDGQGYPSGLAGEAIPLEARIIAIADAYDAMTTYRTYRPGRSSDAALLEIERESGFQFDPGLARLFCKIL